MNADDVSWTFHPDERVDLAVIPFRATPQRGFDCLYIPEDDFLTADKLAKHDIGIGDPCYTVGLFRYVTGRTRNLPMAFVGNIALMSSDEIPIWNERKRRLDYVEGCVIQSQGIQGASGSPVWVRPSFQIQGIKSETGRDVSITVAEHEVRLLGLFQGAWFLPPNEALRAEIGAKTGDTIPVGMGIVVPAQKILDVLQSEELEAKRQAITKTFAARQASVPVAESGPPASDANPTHREDFMRLVNAAAKTPPQGGRT